MLDFTEEIIQKAKNAKRESKAVEFKETFDTNSLQHWCEVIKDIVAMANSGGGIILFGVNDKGVLSDIDPRHLLMLDQAIIVDKVARYTGYQFYDFEIKEVERGTSVVVGLVIKGCSVPMIFNKPGSYDIGNGKQKTAFSQGTIYFRHGAKSEPGTRDDLKAVIERELKTVRKSWLGNIRKVVEAPSEVKVKILPAEVIESDQPDAVPIRIVDDPDAPAYKKVDPNLTHPYRQKEIVLLFNDKSNGQKKITPYDVLTVRKVYKTHENSEFYYKPLFASPQYSLAFVEWLIEQYNNDNNFFENTRGLYSSGSGDCV